MNAEAKRQSSRDWRARNIEKQRAATRRNNWLHAGITDLDAAEAAWQARPAICPMCGREGLMHLDHNHDTGAIRGILCNKCNQGLGLFNDDPALLRRAAEYLEKHV